MKRIQTQENNYLSEFGARIFLQPSSNNYSLKIIASVSQYLVFTLMVSSQFIQSNPFNQVLSTTSIIIFLMIMFLIRYFFRVVVTKFYYLVIILWMLNNQVLPGLKIVIFSLLGLHIIIDLLNQIQFQFTTQNPYSQTINYTKITHYLVLIIASILKIHSKILFQQNIQWIPESIDIVLFLAQAYMKLNSRMKSFLGKQLLIRFYFLSVAFFIKNIVINWVKNVNPIFQYLLVIVSSQVLSTVLIEKFNKIQVDYQISNGNIVKLVFAILSYHFGSVYDPKLEQIARQFCSQNNQVNNLQNQHIMNTISLPKTSHLISDLKSHSNVQKIKQTQKNLNIMRQIMQGSKKKEKIAYKAQQLLNQSIQQQTDDPIACIFLIAQIKFHIYEDIIVAKLILDKLKQEIPWHYLIKKLCIYKFETKIKKQIENKYNISKLDNFKQFFSNQHLRILIIKHSYQYMSMWKYIMTEDFLFKKLAYLLSKLIQKTQRIKNYFQSLVYKCSTIVYLYIEYLYVVRRDIPEALNNFENFQINKQVQSFSNVQNKIYLSLYLEEQVMKIENISYNVKKLLGYDRSIVKNSSLSIFLPSFFVQAHEKITNLAIKSENQNLYLLKKNVYLKHFQGHYLPASLQFKMVYNRSGQLLMQGFMEIIQDTVYDWSNYFVIKSDQQQIIEVGSFLKQFIEITPHKFVYCNQFFQNNVISAISIITQNLIPGSSGNIHAFKCGLQRKYFFQNGTNYQYHLMRQINNQLINYCYYVCQTKIINVYEKFSSEQDIKNRQISQYVDLYYKYQKYPIKFVDFQTNLQNYFQQKQELIKNINNRIPTILFVIAIFVFLVSSGLQGFLVQRVRTTRQTNKDIMIDMDNLVEFYHNLQNLGVMLKRTSFKVNKGKIFYYDYYNVITVCLAIQSKNQLLAKFGNKKYMQVGDQAIKNPKPLKQLISDLVSNYFPVFYYTDPEIVLSCRHNVHTFFRYVWSDALLDYLTVYLASVEKVVDQDNKIKIGVGICLGILMVIIYILLIKVDNYQRDYEYECLNLISSINCCHIFINSINQFLRNAVGNFSQKDLNQKDNKQSFHASFLSRFETNSNISARQNSIRGLFQQDFNTNANRSMQNYTSKNNTILNTLQVKEKAQLDQIARKYQKTRPRSKIFMLLWTCAFLFTVLVGGTNLISDQASNQVKLSRSVKNMLVLLDKQIRFSTIIVCYLDFIAFSFPQDLFIQSYNSYKSVQNEEVAFQQVGYKQFKNFTELLQNVNYVYMCSYMDCDPKYKDSVNIPYYSAIHKLNTFMIDNINVSLSDQTVIDQLQFLFYAHYLIEGTFYKLIKTYMSDYTAFQIIKYNTLYVFYYCQIVSFVIYLLITLILYCRNFKKKQKDCKDILNLIIKQSYNTNQQPQQ